MANALVALDNGEELRRFTSVAAENSISLYPVASVNDVETIISEQEIDVIITDLHFQSGGFADWLFLWQHPFILLADWSEYDRISELITTGTSEFVIRDAEYHHIDSLPLVIRKILNNKESIDRHNLNLRMTEERYHELVQALPDIVYTLDDKGKFIFVNDSVKNLGWSPLDLVGKHFSSIVDPDEVDRVSREKVLEKYRGKVTGPENAPKLFDERRSGDRKTVDLDVKLRRKNASEDILYGSVTAFGEVNAVGFSTFGFELENPGTVGIIRDVTQRIESDRIIRRSLKEKETLLAEIHHRVKNNLQIVSSLLNLQRTSITDPELQIRFTDAQMQIQSMALVHEHLYRTENFGSVDMAEYIYMLADHLYDAYGVSKEKVKPELHLEPIMMSINTATPLALLLNELVSNSLKYAFPDDNSGTLSISLSVKDKTTAVVIVADDGVGLPEDFGLSGRLTLGHVLIQSLTEQINGEIDLSGEGGTRFTIAFPIPD